MPSKIGRKKSIPDGIFAIRLTEAMKFRELNCVTLSEKIGWKSHSTISNLTSGKTNPSFPAFKRIADALHVSMDFLAGRVENPYILPTEDALYTRFCDLRIDQKEVILNLITTFEERNKSKKLI